MQKAFKMFVLLILFIPWCQHEEVLENLFLCMPIIFIYSSHLFSDPLKFDIYFDFYSFMLGRVMSAVRGNTQITFMEWKIWSGSLIGSCWAGTNWVVTDLENLSQTIQDSTSRNIIILHAHILYLIHMNPLYQ